MAQTFFFFASTSLPWEKWILMFKHSLNVMDEWYFIFRSFISSPVTIWTELWPPLQMFCQLWLNIVEICTTFVHCGWNFEYTDKFYLAVWGYNWKPNFIDKINRTFLLSIHIYCLGKPSGSIVINPKFMFILSKMSSRIQLDSWMSFSVNCGG